MPKRELGIIKGTRVKGKGGKGRTSRVKVITPKQAELKRLLKYAATLPDVKPKKVVKPKVKKVAVKPKGVMARGKSLLQKRKALLKRYAK